MRISNQTFVSITLAEIIGTLLPIFGFIFIFLFFYQTLQDLVKKKESIGNVRPPYALTFGKQFLLNQKNTCLKFCQNYSSKIIELSCFLGKNLLEIFESNYCLLERRKIKLSFLIFATKS